MALPAKWLQAMQARVGALRAGTAASRWSLFGARARLVACRSESLLARKVASSAESSTSQLTDSAPEIAFSFDTALGCQCQLHKLDSALQQVSRLATCIGTLIAKLV